MTNSIVAVALVGQLFAFPVTHAYALQVKRDVIVTVTYETSIPKEVCVEAFNLEDPEMLNPADEHCWAPKNVIGDFDTWEKQSINNYNFRVTVRYPSGKIVIINLTSFVNS